MKAAFCSLGTLALVFILSACIFSACATIPKTSRIQATSDFPEHSTGAIFVFKLESKAIVSEAGCTLSLQKNDAIKTYDVDFKPGQDLIFVELPVGIYSYYRIYCGSSWWDERFNQYPAFQVYPGALSLVGDLMFTVDGPRHGHSRTSHFRNPDPLHLLTRIPHDENHHLVSGYTGHEILNDLLEHQKENTKWFLKDAEGKRVEAGRLGWPKFHDCYQNEALINGIFLGELQLTADYENANLTGTSVLPSPNTFTDRFLDCVKATLKDFHPVHLQKSEYFISL